MQNNNDLVWDLDHFGRRQLAQKFVLSFENKLCVYSGSVSQLYTNYNIFFPQEEDRKLVILPNPYVHHDTFHGIPEDACKPTGLLLVPANPDDPRGRLNIIIPLKSDTSQSRKVPLEVGLNLINRKRPPDKPFLPVLIKGDLRELDTKTPCLHLHSLALDHMRDMSEMETEDIRRVILERLNDIACRQ